MAATTAATRRTVTTAEPDSRYRIPAPRRCVREFGDAHPQHGRRALTGEPCGEVAWRMQNYAPPFDAGRPRMSRSVTVSSGARGSLFG